jgi:hypothetical protein
MLTAAQTPTPVATREGSDKPGAVQSPDFKMMAVTIKASPSLEAGVPAVLFDPHLSGYRTRNNYDVTGDGQRFLIKSPALDNAITSIAVTLNWTSLLKK